ncbi:hypothetical protein [Flavobacterium selenitireducens]|uniref:hypothetical protein n=1 Tax=Flavobacterium selenitireducens TaxID=2722704 RepID=UPI00168A9F84|nr:hypothetical protein [Flavobacterium selenitireducens]MBD3583523.1 hypothetical protein [Flavobacterium selenitireducens]
MERIHENEFGQTVYTTNLLYSNYDDTPNPLKGHFAIEGAFYAAFSNNVSFAVKMVVSPPPQPEVGDVLYESHQEPVYGPDGFPVIFQRQCQ